MIISTSWDDGHVLDLRLANLLSKYNLRGTFYIARDFLPERMSDSQIRDLMVEHEIGAHTISHPVLTDIPLDDARDEIVQSRQWLQDLTGNDVTAFCYPKGAQNKALQDLTREAGYQMARGVDGYFLSPSNRFNMETTLHIYPFPLRPLPGYPVWRGIKTRLQPLRNLLPHRARLNLSWMALSRWETLAIALLEQAANEDGIWHLWGHSWEIDKFGMWDALENVLRVAASFKAEIMTNTQLANHIWKTTV